MKNSLWIVLTILLVMMMSGCSTHSMAKINGLKSSTCFDGQELDIIFRQTKAFPENTELSIAKIQDGKVYFYGVIRRDYTIETIDDHTKVFKIGSITKLFTSTLLAQMVIDGKIGLDDNIQDGLPIRLHNDPVITYRQLANHTSGLPREPYYSDREHYEEYSYKDLEEYLQNRLKLDQQDKFGYSNLGVAVLGYTMSQIENRPYEQLLQEKVLKRLEMNSTTTVEEKIKNRRVVSTTLDYVISPAMVSAGGIFSSVEDMARFAIASFDDKEKALRLTQEESFYDNRLWGDLVKMGLGWGMDDPGFTERLHQHQGRIGGSVSSILLDIKHRNGIIILSHQTSFYDDEPNDIGSLSMALMESMY